MFSLFRKLNRWDQSLLVLLSAYLLLWPVEPLSGAVRAIRVALQAAIYAAGAVVLARYGVWAVRLVIRRFLWRVRHRMAAVFFFVGVVPLTLAITLALLGGSLLLGPFAAFIVTSGIEQRAASLQAQAASLGWQVRATPEPEREEAVRRFLENASETFHGIMARIKTSSGSMTYPPGLRNELPPRNLANYRGAAVHEGRLYLVAHSGYVAGSPSVLLAVPLTNDYLAELIPGLGPVEAGPNFRSAELAYKPPRAEPPPAPGRAPEAPPPAFGQLQAAAIEETGPQIRRPRIESFESAHERNMMRYLPVPVHPFDYRIAWPVQVPVMVWSEGEEAVETAFVLYTRGSAVARFLFSAQSQEVSNLVRTGAYVLLGLFGGAIVISFVVAFSLTRTLTRSVHDLYTGTLRVNAGDFAHRVPLHGHNQLTVLALSFNQMTDSIERLVEDSRERERLQSELEIAREVQAQLFPRSVPELKSLEVLGVCRPAQSVSGDFFDYVQLPDGRLALSLGDVSGKGISAALVMAYLHSVLRTQLSLVAARGEWEKSFSTAEVVANSNEQLYAGTAPEKYATLFFGAYDESDSALIYSNAGHPPPLLIRKQEAIPLEVSGLMVGAFPHAQYESAKIELACGDLLVAFTDGVTEPENPYGEEFGVERLKEILIREAGRPLPELINAVMQQVVEWTGASSLQDDMTMLAARRR